MHSPGRDLLDPCGASPIETPARSLLGLAAFAPAERAIAIGCPALFVVCDDDTIVDSGATRQVAAVLEKSTIVSFRGTHVDVFHPVQARGFARTVIERFRTEINPTADQA